MDTVLVFNPQDGRAMGELDCVVVRQWKLQRSQRPERAIIKVKAANYDGNMLQYRNIIVVLSDVVPTWVGYVSVSPANRKWKDGYIYITLFSAEYLLALRRLPYSGESIGTAPNVFSEVITAAEKTESLLFTNIDITGGTRRKYTLEYKRQTCFDAINDIVNNTANYWWVEARSRSNSEVNQASLLSLTARISRKRGSNYQYPLVEGTNLVNIEASEVGAMANSIFVQGSSVTGEDPVEVNVRDEVSINQYGLIEDIYTIREATTTDDLREIGEELLRQKSVPRLAVNADVITEPYPQIGDLAKFELESSFYGGIQQTIIGFNGYLTIKSVAYSPEMKGVNIVADNIYWE